MNTNIKCNSSPDGLPKGMLKLLSYEISYPLSIVFQRFLDEGQCPSFYNYINTKLNNKNLIPPLRNRVDHNIIYTNDFYKADCLSEQFS